MLAQATKELQRTSSLQKLIAHWMTYTLAFSQTVPMGHTATPALSLAKKPRRQHAKLWLNSSTEFVICFMAGAKRKIRDPSHHGIKRPSTHEEDQVFLPVPGENLVCVSIAIERVRDDK